MLQQVHKSAQAIKQQYLHISAICGHELLIDVGSSLSYTAFRGVHTATTSYLQQTGRERERQRQGIQRQLEPNLQIKILFHLILLCSIYAVS